jgi:hypothetical protein
VCGDSGQRHVLEQRLAYLPERPGSCNSAPLARKTRVVQLWPTCPKRPGRLTLAHLPERPGRLTLPHLPERPGSCNSGPLAEKAGVVQLWPTCPTGRSRPSRCTERVGSWRPPVAHSPTNALIETRRGSRQRGESWVTSGLPPPTRVHGLLPYGNVESCTPAAEVTKESGRQPSSRAEV